MAVRVVDHKNSVYHREYSNDVPPQTTLGKRIGVALLPFLGLHGSLRFPLSLGMGTLRVWNTDNKTDQTLAVVALAGTLFKPKLGQILTTIQDILLEVRTLKTSPNYEEASKSLLKILNHLVYLALVTRGGLEMSLICLAMQTVVGLIESRDEFKKDRWIEGCANLLMSCIRIQQLHTQCQQLKKTQKIKLTTSRSDFPSNQSEAQKYADDFIVKYDLPKDAKVFFDGSTNKITVIWRGQKNMDIFRQKYPKPFHKNDWLGSPVQKAKLEFSSGQPISLETVYFGRTGWGKAYDSPNFIVQNGVVSCEGDGLKIRITRDLELADLPKYHEQYDW